MRLALALLLAAAAQTALADSFGLYESFIAEHAQAELSFRQTTVNSDGGRHEAEGTLRYSRPNRFRIVYTEPEPIEIVSDGRRISIYEERLNQVQISDLESNWLAHGLVALLTSDNPQAQFTFSDPPAGDSPYEWLLALPHEKEQAQFEELRLAFTSDGVLARMHVIDLYGNRIEAAFSGVRPAELSDEVFRFTPPPGVDVYVRQ